MTTVLKAYFAVATPCLLAACAPHSPSGHATGPEAAVVASDARMDRVLRGLRPPVDSGAEPVRWTLEQRMEAHAVPGVSIAVVEDGKIAWARGFGVREAGKPDRVTPATPFQAGSLSKPVAVTLMLRLVERGTLDLDADVNRYLRTWRVPASRHTAAEKVTLRRIVTHGAGFNVPGFRGYAPGEPLPSVAQVLAGAAPANNPPIVVDTVPGAGLRYSGGGFMVLQQLLEDVSGSPFRELAGQLVFEPAGMMNSSFAQPPGTAFAQGAARGHDREGTVVPGGWQVLPQQAAAGLWSTPTDLATWMIAVTRAYAGQKSTLLGPALARQMLTPQPNGAGLGVPLSGSGRDLSFSHAGSNLGFIAALKMYPERGGGVVVMTNGVNGAALIQELVRAVAAEYGWPESR